MRRISECGHLDYIYGEVNSQSDFRTDSVVFTLFAEDDGTFPEVDEQFLFLGLLSRFSFEKETYTNGEPTYNMCTYVRLPKPSVNFRFHILDSNHVALLDSVVRRVYHRPEYSNAYIIHPINVTIGQLGKRDRIFFRIDVDLRINKEDNSHENPESLDR